MSLPLEPPFTPMLAATADAIPTEDGWLYEPKWDGFRAVVFRDGHLLRLLSRRGQSLERYFPELLTALAEALPRRCVVDGEIILAGPDGLDFDALLQRIHPAASRVERLARETPAQFVAFDMPALGSKSLLHEPLEKRFRLLREKVRESDDVFVTPQTRSPAVARRWFEVFEGAGLDGIIAKRVDQTYRAGERVLLKVKHVRTADCVVGGYRPGTNGGVGALLLGLYDEDGVLQYVGHTSSFSAKERRRLTELLEPLRGEGGFGEGRTPGGPSRWARGSEREWVPLRPELVCEVAFDHLQGPEGEQRFRHATRLVRWRPDKDPRDCTFEQIEPPKRVPLREVIRADRPSRDRKKEVDPTSSDRW